MLLGGLLGDAWSQLWPGTPLGGYAIIGGAAVLGASMQAPLAAVVLLLELTHQADALVVPILLAVVGATVVARAHGAPSIYSARVRAAGEVRDLQADQVSERRRCRRRATCCRHEPARAG